MPECTVSCCCCCLFVDCDFVDHPRGLLPKYYSGWIVITKVLHVPSMKLNGYQRSAVINRSRFALLLVLGEVDCNSVIPRVIPRQTTLVFFQYICHDKSTHRGSILPATRPTQNSRPAKIAQRGWNVI